VEAEKFCGAMQNLCPGATRLTVQCMADWKPWWSHTFGGKLVNRSIRSNFFCMTVTFPHQTT